MAMTEMRRCALAWALLGLTSCGSGQPIHLGLAGPFSTPRGASMRQAAELAVAEINASGGVRGRPLELVIEDDSAEANVAVQVAERLVRSDVVAVIGHLTSGATLAAAAVYGGATHPVSVISPSASSPRLSEAGPWVFRVCPDDLVHGRRLAEWARRQMGAQTATVIYQNDDYGRGVRRTFMEAFTALQGTVSADDPYIDELPTFEPYLRRAAQHGGTDVLMIAGSLEGAERVLQTMDSVGLHATVMGGDALAGLEASGIAEGVYVSTAYLPDRPGAKNQAFVSAYRRAYGDAPDHRGAGAYDSVYLLARAVAAVGTDRAAIRDYLAGVGTATPPFEGVTGTIAFDEHGDVPNKSVVIGVVRGSQLVTVTQ